MTQKEEEAQLLWKLARGKGNWGAKYDRLEHYKRFNIKPIVKELSSKGWIIVHNKPKFTAISLDTKYKKEIIEFIEEQLPYLKGTLR